jgi:hypothetical protein
MKFVLGILCGILLMLIAIFVITGNNNTQLPQTQVPDTSSEKGIKKKGEVTKEDFFSIKMQQGIHEESLAAYNRRIDDILSFGGIIVTLLLVIVAGVYVKAERDVDKHLKEQFQTYQSKIIKIVDEADIQSSIALAQLEVTTKFIRKSEPSGKVTLSNDSPIVQRSEEKDDDATGDNIAPDSLNPPNT